MLIKQKHFTAADNKFITAVCAVFLMKARWSKSKSLHHNTMTGFLSDLGGGTHIFTGKGVRRRRILSRIEATPITLHYITKQTHDRVPFRPRGRYSFFSGEEGFGGEEFCRELKQHPLHYITLQSKLMTGFLSDPGGGTHFFQGKRGSEEKNFVEN